jgi:tRNA uridine 5-carboxymethylaminomethyl modification enzyme
MAGINATRRVQEKEPVILKRSDAYIGVLIDDLINKGTDEPYRMFTSRAEYRTLLRQDNADIRLTKLGYDIGLAKQDRYDNLQQKLAEITRVKKTLTDFPADPVIFNEFLINHASSPLTEKGRALKILTRPDISIKNMIDEIPSFHEAIGATDPLVLEQVEIQIKYEVYLEKEKELVNKMALLEEQIIPDTFNYDKLNAISTEARQKLTKIRPRTIGQAGRISGVNPSDIQILLVYMGR